MRFFKTSGLLLIGAVMVMACGLSTPAQGVTSGPVATSTAAGVESPTAADTAAPSETADLPTYAPPVTDRPLEIGTLGAPLLLLADGDIWAWDGPGKQPRNMTSYHYNYNPVISPDGKYVAYNSIAKGATPPSCSGWPPSNIWVMNIATGDAVRVADQPLDAVFCNSLNTPVPEGMPSPEQKFIQRPRVTWSPDSKSLAWGEIATPQTDPSQLVYRLVVTDMRGTLYKVFVDDIPGYQGISDGQRLDWGEAGIADVTPGQDVMIFDPNGGIVSQIKQGSDFNPCLLGGGLYGRWVNAGDKSALLYNDCNANHLLDLAGGEPAPASSRIEMFSLTAPDGPYAAPEFHGSSDVIWHITRPGAGTPPLSLTAASFDGTPPAEDVVAIAPDGKYVAYLGADGRLTIYGADGGATQVELSLPDGKPITWIGWGPVGWRVGN